MPYDFTQEQIQRHNMQLEAARTRSANLNATFADPLYQNQQKTVDTTPFFLKGVPYLEQTPEQAEPVPAVEHKESRSERKKRESMEKQYRRAREAKQIADFEEGSITTSTFRAPRHSGRDDALEGDEYKRERFLLDKRLAAIEEQEKADLLAVDLLELKQRNIPAENRLSGENSPAARRLEAQWNAQKTRAEAYHNMAAQMPLGSAERKRLMSKTEEEVLKAGHLKREYSVACMPEGQEKQREAATIKRHGRFDALKKIFRIPSPYSHEDAVVRLENGRVLVNAGRATLGGTKAMYIFEDQNELVNDHPQEWLFKEATNCIGMAKPEGAIVTGEASKLQRRLRGDLSIPAQCLRDADGNVVGSIQKRVQKAAGGVDLFKWQAQEDLSENAPSPVTMADLMHEHTLDWILCNFDTKGENFINQPEGHIISFDKEASFNTLLQDGSQHMSYTFKPHSNDTIYNTMFRAFAEGTIDLDLNANLGSIQEMERMESHDFIAMFRETLDTKYGTGTQDRDEAEERLTRRHQGLREEYRTFYTRLIQERIDNIRKKQPDNTAELMRLEEMLTDGKFVFSDGR